MGWDTVPPVGTAGWDVANGSRPVGWGTALHEGCSLRYEIVSWEWAIYSE